MAKKSDKNKALDKIVEEVPEAEVVTESKNGTVMRMIGGRMREIEVE